MVLKTIKYDPKNDLMYYMKDLHSHNDINFRVKLEEIANGRNINTYNKIIVIFENIKINRYGKINISIKGGSDKKVDKFYVNELPEGLYRNTQFKSYLFGELSTIDNINDMVVKNKTLGTLVKCKKGKKCYEVDINDAPLEGNARCIKFTDDLDSKDRIVCGYLEGFNNDEKTKIEIDTDEDLILLIDSNEIEGNTIDLKKNLDELRGSKKLSDFKKIGFVILNHTPGKTKYLDIDICAGNLCNNNTDTSQHMNMYMTDEELPPVETFLNLYQINPTKTSGNSIYSFILIIIILLYLVYKLNGNRYIR